MFLFKGAPLPYRSYSGKNSVSFKPFSSAYSFARVSTPYAPPDIISVVSFGINLDISIFVIFLEPIIAVFIPILRTI